MKNAWKLLFVIIISIIQNGCKNSTEPESVNTILNSNFEQEGKSSLENWKDGYPIYGIEASSFSFSKDTPFGGGKWSLKLQSPFSGASVMRLSLIPNLPGINKTFHLTFWCKNNKYFDCAVDFVTYSGDQSFAWSVQIDSSGWKQYSISGSSNGLSTDSLGIFIAMYPSSDTSNFALFDRFKIEQN